MGLSKFFEEIEKFKKDKEKWLSSEPKAPKFPSYKLGRINIEYSECRNKIIIEDSHVEEIEMELETFIEIVKFYKKFIEET